MTIATDRNAQDARIESDDLRLQIADAAFLKVFLELHGEARAARWRGLDFGAKFRLVARQMTAQLGDWNDTDVRGWIERYDVKYALSPLDAAVEGALERLAGEHSAAARLAVASGDKGHATEERRQTTAFTNALIQYRAGVRPELLASGAWLLPSRRAGEAPHIVRMDGDWTCSCVAHDSMHWPIALVIGLEVAGDMLEAHDDGAPESELAAAIERTNAALDAMRMSQRLCKAGRFSYAA